MITHNPNNEVTVIVSMVVIKREQHMVHNIKMTIDAVFTQEEFGGTFPPDKFPEEFLLCLRADTL